MRLIPLVALTLLGSCAAPTECKKIVITKTDTVMVDHYVTVHPYAPAHAALINLYTQTRAAEVQFVAKSKAPTIDQLIKLNMAAAKAFVPIEDPDHKATPAEVTSAIESLGAIQAFINVKH
jgi:hypothetical protein